MSDLLYWDGITAPGLAPGGVFKPMILSSGIPVVHSTTVGSVLVNSKPTAGEYPCPYQHGDVLMGWNGGSHEHYGTGIDAGASGVSIYSEDEKVFERGPYWSWIFDGRVIRMLGLRGKHLQAAITVDGFSYAFNEEYGTSQFAATAIVQTFVRFKTSGMPVPLYQSLGTPKQLDASGSFGDRVISSPVTLPIWERYIVAVAINSFSTTPTGLHGVYGPNPGRVSVSFSLV